MSRLKSKDSFDTLLDMAAAKDFIDIESSLKFSNAELDSIKAKVPNITLDKEVKAALKNIKAQIEIYNSEALTHNAEIIDVSERRWIAIMESKVA